MQVRFTLDDSGYTYDRLEKDIKELQEKFPWVQHGVAGQSVLGRKLYWIRLGNGPNRVFYNGVHHGLEWITAPLLMNFAFQFCEARELGAILLGYDPREICERTSLYILPMVNPDGAQLVQQGLDPGNPYARQLQEWNRMGRSFSRVWKANIRGVDLNLNYPSGWEMAKVMEAKFDAIGPSPVRHPGPYPLSEPETSAVVRFVREQDFRLLMAFHTQGRVIYWNYQGQEPVEARSIAERLSRASGYEMEETVPEDSYAGCKDWFIQEFGRPGFTIEVGWGKNPLPVCQFGEMVEETLELMLLGTEV